MATLYESYTGTHTYSWWSQNTIWGCMTFTPQISHSLTAIRLYLMKYGSPGTVTISIRATDVNGAPTGGDLAIASTFQGNDLLTSMAWKEIAMNAVRVTAGIMYAIVIRVLAGDGSNFIYYAGHRQTNGETMYSGGSICSSSNSGSTWTIYDGSGGQTDDDALFQDWGDPLKARSQALIIG